MAARGQLHLLVRCLGPKPPTRDPPACKRYARTSNYYEAKRRRLGCLRNGGFDALVGTTTDLMDDEHQENSKHHKNNAHGVVANWQNSSQPDNRNELYAEMCHLQRVATNR